MGLTYSFNVIIKNERRDDAISLIKKKSFHFADNLFSKGVMGASLIFNEDKFIKDYHQYSVNFNLENYPDTNPSLDDYRVGTDQFWLGSIYIDIDYYTNPGESKVCFEAAASTMSILFSESKSIQNFFKDFCQELDASYCYLDMEDGKRKSIWGIENV